MAWGNNSLYGQCPVPAGLSDVVQVAAGHAHSLALKSDGPVVAWGGNNYNQCNVPAGLSGVIKIDAGEGYHSLALKSDGTVVAWGRNTDGQCTLPEGLTNVVDIAGGFLSSMALLNVSNQEAPPSAPVANAATDVTTTSFSANWSASAGAANYFLDVATDSGFTVFVTGYQNRLAGSATTIPVAGLAAGGTYFYRVRAQNTGGTSDNSATITVTLLADQVIDFPAIGNQLTTNVVVLSATASSGLPVNFAVANGPGSLDNTTLTFTGAGIVSIVASQAGNGSWGPAPNATNTFAVSYPLPQITTTSLPNGTEGIPYSASLDATNGVPPYAWSVHSVSSVVAWWQTSANQPEDLEDVVAIAGGYLHSLALKSDGTVVAWGDNEYGQLNVPGNLTNGIAISTRHNFSLAVKSDGTVVAWGDNSNGQTNVPAGLTGVVNVAAGQVHSLALKSDGTVVAWGRNSENQSTVPTGLTGVVAIAAGSSHSLALKADGSVVTWGNNLQGQCTVPTGLTGVVAIAAGSYHSLALKGDGTVVAWGYNYLGQTNVPSNLTGVVSIAAGTFHNLALKSDGTVAVFGWYNVPGGLVPEGLRNVTAIAAGGYHSMALRSDFALPAGLSCSTNGMITGTPTQAGTNWVMFVVQDSVGGTTNKALEIVIEPALPELLLSQTDVNVREGGEGRFFVRLDRAPAANVVVDVARTSGAESLEIASGASLTFKPSNWSTWQVVTLTAPDDANAVGETTVFRVSLAGADDQFVTATALDDDIAENLALASSGTTISGTRGYRLADAIDGQHVASSNYAFTTWASVPPGAITLDLQAAMAVSRVRILTWDWNYRDHRYVIEASVDGASWSLLADASAGAHRGWEDWAVADEPIRYLRFTGLENSANSAVCLPEWEVYGARPLPELIQLSETNVNVREGGEGRFFVRLDRAPAANVVVDVARTSGDDSLVIASGASLTFRPSDWNMWQVVTLTQADDGNADGETAVFRVSLAGADDQFVTATALDDDIAENLALASSGTTISGTRGYRLADAIDGQHVASSNYAFTTWASVPPGAITLDLQAAMAVSRVRILTWDWNYRDHRYVIEASVDGASWSLLADASAGAHRGWEDWAVADEPIRYLRFTGLENSANSAVCLPEWEVYGARPLPELIQLSKTGVNVREGGEGRFFVRLASEPAANVVVDVARTSGDESLVIASGANLTFKPSNWSTWQAVTLTQADDADADGETATLEVSMPGVLPRTVAVAALDDDIGDNLALASAGTTLTGRRAYFLPYVIDGVHTVLNQFGYTIWTNVPPGTMTLDLRQATTVSRVRVLNWDWTCRFHRYVVEGSADGSSWTTLADASGADRQGWDDWAVADVTVRYVRFTGLTNSANVAVCISELEVIGTRAATRRSLASTGVMAAESAPVSVLTSDGPTDETGWNAVDGDENTAWIGQKAGGGYVVVEYAPAMKLSALEVVLSEGSLTNVQYLYGGDAQNWQPLPEDLESNPISLNYLWLIFPDDGTDAVPQVLEIVPNP